MPTQYLSYPAIDSKAMKVPRSCAGCTVGLSRAGQRRTLSVHQAMFGF
jgi:hypothetical protein